MLFKLITPAALLISAGCFFLAGMPLLSVVMSVTATVLIVAINLKK